MMNVSKPSGIPGVPKVTEAGLADLGWSTEEYRGACVKTGALNIQCLIPYAISAVLGALFAIVLSRLIGPTADAHLIAIMVDSFLLGGETDDSPTAVKADWVPQAPVAAERAPR